MIPPSSTSTAKEKDDSLAGVTVDGGGGASAGSASTSMMKPKLLDTQNESRVNRKSVTTSLSSMPAPMSINSKF